MTKTAFKQDLSFISHIMASGPGLVAIVREDDLKIVFVNNLFESELGCSNNDINDQDVYFSCFIDEYQQDRLKYHMKSVKDVHNKSTAYIIYNIKARGGDEFKSYYLFTSLIPDIDGKYGNLYKILLLPDLSQWSMPFTSFETRELFLEHFESEDFGTFEWLVDVDKSYWSEGVYKIYEVESTPNGVSKFFASAFVHPEDKEWVSAATDNVISGAGTLDIEFRIITGKNNIKRIHSLAKVVRDKDGKAIKFLGSLRDVTRQRNIENDLKKKVEELFESNKELEEFAYVASHDMQEPLRKITTFSSRLMEKYKDVLTGDGAMYLSRMTASAENMRVLINDLLEFSRIASTQQPFSEVDLNMVLRQVKTDLELVIEESATEITSDNLPVVEAVASQMKQLFTNILSNAIKFRNVGIAPIITIHASAIDIATKLKYELHKDKTYYKIVISDNGIGFEEEYSLRIFNVFQRLHGKSEYPGSGIGLAICKKILEHHNGIIYAESVYGKGAKFIFIIPENRS